MSTQLAYLARQVNAGNDYAGKHVTLTRNLNLNSHEWTAIGTDYTHSFSGVFDGANHVIYNLSINKPGNPYQGLFGYLDGAVIKKLGLENVNVRGQSNTGGVAGQVSNSGSIENCYSTGNVSGTFFCTGGVVGYVATNSSVADSYSTGNVSGVSIVGGVAGQVDDNSSIADSYSTGNVSGTSNVVGGIAGHVSNTSSIENCYSTGNVSGTDGVGGVAGWVYSSSIADSYSTGNVSGTSYSVGGVAGSVDGGSIADSYSTGNVSGTGSDVGGVAGQVSDYLGGSSIEYCAALNPSVSAAGNAGRVVGSITGTGHIFTGNVAWDDMTVTGSTVTDNSQKDGAGRANTAFHSAAGFPFTVNAAPSPWVYTPGTLPILIGIAGQNSALPAHLQ